MGEEIVYSPNKYRETEGIKVDGDIVLTTNNEYFIKGSHKDHPIITYEKGLASPNKINIKNITNTVIKGFGSGVGGFSNAATCMYAMAGIFKDDDPRKTELMNRIKLEREIVGQEIDRIKGAAKPYLPSDWKSFQTINPDDSEEIKKQKYLNNSIVISKKPYFFRYLYPELNQRYKQFEASYNQVSLDMFGVKFKKLLKINPEERTKEQNDLIRRYEKYNPLITSDCTMNRLCRELENCDFDIRFAKGPDDKKRKAKSMLPTYEPLYEDSFSQERFDFVRSLYKKYNARRQAKMATTVLDTASGAFGVDDYAEIRTSAIHSMYEDMRMDLEKHSMSGEEFLFYCNRISSCYSNFNWGFAWDVLEEQIIPLIPFGVSLCPIHSEAENAEEYLGEKFILKDISKRGEIGIQTMINSVFGSYDGMPPSGVDLSSYLGD